MIHFAFVFQIDILIFQSVYTFVQLIIHRSRVCAWQAGLGFGCGRSKALGVAGQRFGGGRSRVCAWQV